MLQSSHAIGMLLSNDASKDPLVIEPRPNIEQLKNQGSAAVDLRLGTWFLTMKVSTHTSLDVYEDHNAKPTERSLCSKHYVPFGGEFILHPHSFVLASTLEWIRMPHQFAGYVTGKSSWGRRGLVIETAPGVHPGFTGCLTLELTNLGQLPIVIKPGSEICQLFIHRLEGDTTKVDQSRFVGQRQPRLGDVKVDRFAQALQRP